MKWNTEELRVVLLEEKVKEIRRLLIPSIIQSSYDFCWARSVNGAFSVSSVYDLLHSLRDRDIQSMEDWRRHFTDEGDCCVCPGIEESILHCLRDCPVASNVRRLIFLGVEGLVNFWSRDTMSWLKAGVEGFSTDISFLNTNKFVAVIWIIWKARCTCNIKKSPQLEDNFKVNTDGSVSQSNGHAATGGILRNSRGEWVAGFYINVRSCSLTLSVREGLYLARKGLRNIGLKEGLYLAKRKGLRNIELEVDSTAVVSLLGEAYNNDHHLSALIKDCRSLMVKVNTIKINYTFREGNKCADLLVALGHNSRPGVCELLNPPDSLLPFLRNDAMGIKFLRVKNNVCMVSPRGMCLGC
ncbi:Ribonuclease H domain [Dillenia turbinata]|uniref:Ribonuclease H domain n=1 Tax=Dillenia turbinata TaxID=194707 RepID=A0AAN8UYX0_9MAGN